MQRGTTATDRGTGQAAGASRGVVSTTPAASIETAGEAVERRPTTATGLEYARVFAREGVDPFDEIEWDTRSAVIGNEKGALVFEQRDVEVPKFWSQQATNIVVSKYFRGTLGTPGRERSVKQLVGRVVDTITGWARKQRYFASEDDLLAFSDDLKHLLVYQKAAFNSPVWFNVGIEPHPQCSACFINAVQDTMDSILGLAKTEGMLFKYGSGTGSNLSAIRSSKELLAGGGTASGPVSFMKGFDAFAGVIKSGGKTRRAAKMVILNADHPDIAEFINCKVEEEKKAWALIDAGYDGSFTGPAYASVFFQNSNNSVRVTDEFMRAVLDDKPWQTRSITTGEVMDTYKARDLMHDIAEATHDLRRSGHAVRHDDERLAHVPEHGAHQRVEPVLGVHVPRRLGVQPGVDQPDEVRRRPGRVRRREVRRRLPQPDHRAGDPGRQLQLSDARHRAQQPRLPSARPGLRQPRRAADVARPALRQRRRPRLRRRPSPRSCTARPTPSRSRVARDHGGPFAGYEMNREPMLRVMRKHRAALKDIDRTSVPKEMFEAARGVWDECVELGEQFGYRNAQATVLAPTGTIGFMMDCDTTGVEPDIALVKYKKLVGGGMMKIVNQTVPIGAAAARLLADRDHRRSSSTSTSTRRSKARRTSRTRTCRCSTAPSSRSRASARSSTWATSG